jgi:fibronectin-binding autotransporter adhesin
VISGTNASFTKEGLGALIFDASNLYTGTTSVNAGTLAITKATGLGSTSGSTTIASGATLDLQNVTVGSEGIIINGGTLATTTGTSSLTGTVSLGGSSDSTFLVAGTQLTLTSVISGTTRGLIKTGSGVLVLDAFNTYQGGTVINDGTLSISKLNIGGVSSGIGSSSSAASNLIINGGILKFTGSSNNSTDRLFTGSIDLTIGTSTLGTISRVDSSNPTLTLTGSRNATLNHAWADPSVSGVSALTKSGSATWTIGNGSNNSYSGITTISGGVLAVSSLVNGGANSGIGKSSNAASNLVIDGGTLTFIGTTVAANTGG